MYEEEIAFLAGVENRSDPTYGRRKPLDPAALERIRRAFPGIPEDYLSYLGEIGWGTTRECKYMIYQGPRWCHEDFNWFESDDRKLLVVGDDFSGNLYALAADENYRIVLLLHETMEVLPVRGTFRQFIRQEMLLGPDGTDQRGRR
jgi:hypothetical protein